MDRDDACQWDYYMRADNRMAAFDRLPLPLRDVITEHGPFAEFLVNRGVTDPDEIRSRLAAYEKSCQQKMASYTSR